MDDGVTDPLGVMDPDGEYVVTPTIFRLTWGEGEKHHGLVVRVRSLPFGELLEIAPVIDAIAQMRPADLAGHAEEVLRPFRVLASHLVSWNLVEEVQGVRTPVPATFEGLIRQDPQFLIAVMQAWARASGGVPDPLAQPSSGGVTGPPARDRDMEASLVMTTLGPGQQAERWGGPV